MYQPETSTVATLQGRSVVGRKLVNQCAIGSTITLVIPEGVSLVELALFSAGGLIVIAGVSFLGLMATQTMAARFLVRRASGSVLVERCSECGFDGETTSSTEAVEILAELPDWWAAVVTGLSDADLRSRPISTMWSIAEYTDHVRETTFGMRFVLDTALESPGVDLGPTPVSVFDKDPRDVAMAGALDGFRSEITKLVGALETLTPEQWTRTVILDDKVIDGGWVVRHAVHDITHHIGDIQRLKDVLAAS